MPLQAWRRSRHRLLAMPQTKRHRPLVAGNRSSRRHYRLGPLRPHPHLRTAVRSRSDSETIRPQPRSPAARQPGSRPSRSSSAGETAQHHASAVDATAHTGNSYRYIAQRIQQVTHRRPQHRNCKPAQRAGRDRISRRLSATRSRWPGFRGGYWRQSHRSRLDSRRRSRPRRLHRLPPRRRHNRDAAAHLARRQAGHILELERHHRPPRPALRLFGQRYRSSPATKASAPPRSKTSGTRAQLRQPDPQPAQHP